MYSNRVGFASYDIEIVEDLPEGETVDLRKITPSIGAIATSVSDVEFFYDLPYMTKETGVRLVNRMMKLYRQGYIPFGWNSLSFDFQLIAHYTGMYEECATLALNGYDPMFMVVAIKGYYLGLNKVLIGANIAEKVHNVQLKDGTNFANMSGASAPLLWRSGEIEAVKEYLHGDVVQPYKLALDIEHRERMDWTSATSKKLFVRSPLLTVKECLKLPVPDVSWMSKPKHRHEYYSWIPLEILRKEIGSEKAEEGEEWKTL